MVINNLRSHSSNLFIFITIFIALVVILSCGVGNVAAANPGDIIYVNSSGGHDSNNGSSWLYAKQSISNAVGTVNTNGTVNIADGQYTGSSNTGITINKNMSIIGESQSNTIINGQQSGKQVFIIIPGVSVAIINLTFTNNNATGYGGAIYNNGTLTVTNDKFTNNIASWYGGAIYNSGILNGNNNIFYNNTVNSEGGAIYNNNTLSETNSTFYNNTATAAGGAIFNEITLTLNNNIFNNNAANFGGAILNWDLMTDTNNTFINNIAKGGGAAINNQDNLIETNDTFINNTSMSDLGGAIFSYNSTTETNCTFINNTVLSGYGGAIMSIGALTMTNNIYINNAATYGGAIYSASSYYFDGNSGILNDINCTFISNTATTDGGAIYNNGTLIETNNTFTNNIASDDGGAIYNDVNYNLTDTNSIYNNNSASYGGAVYNDGTLFVNNSTFTNNNATDGGGVIFNEYGNAILQYNRIVGNTASSGSSIYSFGGTVNATFNWWGSDLGPSTEDIYGNVTTTPWLVVTANATPNGGLYGKNQTVNLDMNTAGTIYYTMDGSDPTTSSSIYILPINISTSTVLKYISVDTAGDESPIYTQTYTIDTIPPTANANPTGGLYNTPQNVTLTMSDAGTIYYTTDGTTPTNSSTSYKGSIPITENTTLRYIAIDDADNVSSVYTQTYIIDTTIPTASVNVKGGLYNTNQVVTLTMSEPGNLYYTLNGTTPTSKSTLYTKPITIASTSTLKYFAIDNANNKSSTYIENYIIDKTTPEIIKTNPKYNAIKVPLTTPLTITFNENILKGINYNNIYVKNLNTGKLVHITKTLSKNTLTIKMTKSRLHNDKYIIYIPKDAFKDLAGNLTATYTIRFKTG